MQTYNIPADRVIRHYDVSGKLCPGIIGWNEDSKDISQWKEFKAKLSNTANTTNSKTDDVIYRVRKSANDAKSQIGAYRSLNSAKALADKNSGYSVFEKDSGKLVYTPTAQTAKKKTVTEVAKEVIQGKWGNGEDRKNRLTKAGYDYRAVQAEVNRLMSV